MEITDFQTFLGEILEENEEYVGEEITKLTNAAENYGSIMLAIKIMVKNDDQEKIRHLVAKIIPPNQHWRKFMNIPFIFRNELGFYKTIIPCLRQFLKEKNSEKSLDAFPKFYGGRLSFASSDMADDDALILMENLQEVGYTIIDKTVGFDLDTAKLILTKLAEVHATPLALKILQPETFETTLMPYFEQYEIFVPDENMMETYNIIELILDLVQEDELCALHSTKIKEALTLGFERIQKPKNSPEMFPRSPFTTLVHGDLWVNNIMVKINKNKISDVKLVDFQLYEYFSLTRDILFFLFTSVQITVLRDHLDKLIIFYYNNFINDLKELECDTSQLSLGAFKEEMKSVAKHISYFHIMSELYPIFATKNEMLGIIGDEDKLVFKPLQSSEVRRVRACLITREFIQRGWI